MDRGLFIAGHIAHAMQERQAIIANNLANISTTGFKRQFQQQSTTPTGGQGVLGTRGFATVETPGVDKRPGVFNQTGNPLDIALGTNQYVKVSSAQGDLFTRRGDLQVSVQSQLVLSDGTAVLSDQDEPIAIPVGFSVSIGADGSVWAQDPVNRAELVNLGILGVFTTDGPLTVDDSGFLRLSNPQVAVANVKAGVLESSNVSAPQMMVEMIETSRLQEVSIKLIQNFEAQDRRGSELLGLYR